MKYKYDKRECCLVEYRKPYIPQSEEEANEAAAEERRELPVPPNKRIPVLPKHQPFFESLGDKLLEEGKDFEVKFDGWVPSYNDPDNIGCLPNGEPIAVPIQPEEEDLWEEALDLIEVFCDGVCKIEKEGAKKFMKNLGYTIKKK